MFDNKPQLLSEGQRSLGYSRALRKTKVELLPQLVRLRHSGAGVMYVNLPGPERRMDR